MLFEVFECIELLLVKLTIGVDALFDHLYLAGDNNLLVDVLYEGLYERRADSFNSLLKPDVVVEELSLAGENAQLDSKIVIIAINDLYEAIFDVLGDV